ncbi:DUF4129 domain-containing protein [Microbacterium indicum]|uniref:DUF4129 domain-containing protein n=1 Tax=Microbacterium indicum TaxID=358100 RepID=UPI0004115163|nr:DUF4129 domain-containing protein [Microbacterium indicum]
MTSAAVIALAALPDPDDARDRAAEELAKRVYAEAEPTVFDRVAQAIGEFIMRLLNPQLAGGSWSPLVTALIVAVVVALVVVAIVIWGVPRRDRRSATSVSSSVIGDDLRTAAQLRADAASAASRGDWDAALVLRFRAIARGLDERGVLHAPPGMTARALAEAASRPFPDHAAGLCAASRAFDDVRYLRRHATSASHDEVAALDDAIAAARPATAPGSVLS